MEFIRNAQDFVIGKEMPSYRDIDKMLELSRYYLSHQEEVREIAKQGQECCLKKHGWLHPYQKNCQLLKIL